MKNVVIVSYPRSGQHYFEKLLKQVTGQWRDFILKWAAKGDAAEGRDNVLPMRYEDIIQSDKHVKQTFEFLFDDYDKSTLEKAMAAQREKLVSGEQRQRDLSAFQYPLHDGLMADIRAAVGPKALELVGYDDVM